MSFKKFPYAEELERAQFAGKVGLLICPDVKDAKAAEGLGASGFRAITIPVTDWHRDYREFFGGWYLVILPKQGTRGRDYANRIKQDLRGLNSNVLTVFTSQKIGCGIADWVQEGHNVIDFEELIAKAGEEEQKPSPKGPKLISALSVAYKPPEWTLEPYIPADGLTIIQGDPGTGKTALACAFAACVSSGKSMDGALVQRRGDVLMISTEDPLGVLRGRMEASGADLRACHFVSEMSQISFLSPEIERWIKETKAALVVFDPIQAFLGATVDMHRANETRPILVALAEIAERNKCAIVLIAHTAKSRDGKSPVNWALGSTDIPGAARSVLLIIKDPESKRERLAIHVKSSNAPQGDTIKYEIVDRGGVRWLGYSSITGDDLAWINKRKEKEKIGVDYDKEPLVQVFRQFVADHPGGGFIQYAKLKEYGMRLLGFPPFTKIGDLRAKLDTGFCRELLEKDGLIVTHGAIGRSNMRGIRIDVYEVPAAYQGRLQDD